ncbi:MAG: ATP-binding protein [Chitinophagales bacterium]
MISTEELIKILEKSESSTLDFKENFYDFADDRDLKNTAKFIKDVISFSNTIRNENGFILFGVKEKTDKNIELVGLNNSVDDSILQEKVKDKVFPRPFFKYYELNYESKKVGILEFPIAKYELPITPTVKLKGLEAGKVYYRNGSSNTEANAIDVIRINDWFKSLPGNLKLTLSDKISEILKRLTLNQEKLSVITTDLLNIAKIHELTELEIFCSAQIKGIKHDEAKNHKYRIQKVFISPNGIETNPYSLIDITTDIIKKEMEKDDSFFEYRMLLNHSIVKIEELMERFKNNKTYATVRMSSQHLFGKGDYDINVFIFENNIRDVYSNIRQKTIDELMKI